MKSSLPQSITIDGPVAAGKSTVGKAIVEKLGYLMIDTGFFYRTVTYIALKKHIDVKNNELTGNLAEKLKIELKIEKGNMRIIADREDVTGFLKTPEVDKNVQFSSRSPRVRKALTPKMRNIAEKHNVVMMGRDIGTVVLPDADLKIWLDASSEERAKRRVKELKERGIIKSYEEVLKDMKLRDKIDSERSIAPMKIPEDAVIIDSNNLTIPETIEKTFEYIKNWPKK